MKLDGNINGPWEPHVYNDTNYAGDNDTRKSMAGYIFRINIAVIACHSRTQKTVTLSVTEAEDSEITEVCS